MLDKIPPTDGNPLPPHCEYIGHSFERRGWSGRACFLTVLWCGVEREFFGLGLNKLEAWNDAVEKSKTSYYD